MGKPSILTFFLVGLACAPAFADTFYTNRATFLAATTGVTTIDFEGLAPDNGFVFEGGGPGAGITISGVRFAVGPTSNGNAFVAGKGFYYPGTSVFSSQESGTASEDLLVTLPSSTAVGFDFGDFNGQTLTILLSNGSSESVTAPPLPGLDFFGVTSMIGIIGVDITTPVHDPINIDNFSFGTAVIPTVPEPSAWLLLGTLVAAVGILRHRTAALSR